MFPLDRSCTMFAIVAGVVVMHAIAYALVFVFDWWDCHR